MKSSLFASAALLSAALLTGEVDPAQAQVTAEVTTLTGGAGAGYRDGTLEAAQFYFPNGACVDAAGDLYVADGYNHRIRKISPSRNQVLTLAGTGAMGLVDGPGKDAKFTYPLGLYVGFANEVYVADTGNNVVRKLSQTAWMTVTTIAGTGAPGYFDGSPEAVKFNFPNDLVVDPDGNLIVTEMNNHCLRKVTLQGITSTLAGNGAPGTADGSGTRARFNQPGGLGIHPASGIMYVSEWGGNRIRKVLPDGTVSTFAGSGVAGFADGTGEAAQFNAPDGVAVDQEGNVYVCEHWNHAIRRITAQGVVTTLAGGRQGTNDGPGLAARFNGPGGLCVADRTLWVADTSNHRIRKVRLVTGAPEITAQPVSQTAVWGGGAELSVTAAGPGALTYQWFKDGEAIPGATGPSLQMSNLALDQGGSYAVEVSNGMTSVRSNPAALTITPAQVAIGLYPGLLLQGTPGKTVEIQYQRNELGAAWTPVQQVSLGDLPTLWLDTNVNVAAGDQPRGFYRVTVPASAVKPPPGMVLIPAGAFQMGDTFGEGLGGELPVHTVTLSAFYMDRTEVTKALWVEVADWAVTHGYDLHSGSGEAASHPADTVSWYNAVKWCNARSQREGRLPAYYTDAALTAVYKTGSAEPYVWWDRGFRLPTEAEWEYAARGGLSGRRFPWGDTISHSQANYYSRGPSSYDVSPTRGLHPTYATGGQPNTSPVGSFSPNGYGLYDMAGNVWEWCWDWYGAYGSFAQTNPRGSVSSSLRVIRGGSCHIGGEGCRLAHRDANASTLDDRYDRFGFRAVLAPGQ